MSKTYKHIFFDLDHTLWDFDKNSSETLLELYQYYAFDAFSAEDFVTTFSRVNARLWEDYNKGTMDREALRNDRFKLILTTLGMVANDVPSCIATRYLELCPAKPHVFPFTIDMLSYLQENYELHILTNGFEDVQAIKLESAQLTSYFKHIITADAAGFQKPSKEIFTYALNLSSAKEHESLMIGDNLKTDVAGARAANIDQVYFNPRQFKHKESVTYEISCLSELRAIL